MRPVVYVDRHGWKRRSLVRDQDGDEMAVKGIPAGPPDLRELDWDVMMREINNAFVDHKLFTWKDINDSQVGLSVISGVVKRHVRGLYHEQEKQLKSSEVSQ